MKLHKQARRERALARFHILSKEEYINISLVRTRNRMTIRQGDAGYSDYVARKQQELASLESNNA